MPLLSRLELSALEKGRLEGRLEGELLRAKKSLLDVIAVRFGSISDGLHSRIEKIEVVDQLDALLRRSLVVDSLDNFMLELDQFLDGL